MAVPGLVLGLSYIFFFNAKSNPLGFIYATMAILVVNSITHFYTVSHLTATAALKQLDPEFEAVSSSLRVSLLRTMARVTIPVCLPSILDISIYLFVNAMTTVSAVIFLYSTDTKLASVTIINMDEAGFTAAAATMAVAIVATSGRGQARARAADAARRARHAGVEEALEVRDGACGGSASRRACRRQW